METTAKAPRTVKQIAYDLAEIHEELWRLGDQDDPAPKIVLLRGKPRRTLDEQELRVMQLLCQGLTNKEVSTAINMKIRTIESVRLRVCRKLKSNNLLHAVAILFKSGALVVFLLAFLISGCHAPSNEQLCHRYEDSVRLYNDLSSIYLDSAGQECGKHDSRKYEYYRMMFTVLDKEEARYLDSNSKYLSRWIVDLARQRQAK